MKAKASSDVDPGDGVAADGCHGRGFAVSCPPFIGDAHVQDLDRLIRETLPMARIERQPLPGCPRIVLGLINADFPLGPLPPEVMRAVIARPAYWAFCWGSGLALARFLLDRPEWVRGRQVLDFGSGSGVVAVAAALAGAARVVACDNDPAAMAATRANAAENGVPVEVVADLAAAGTGYDLLLMADVLYDRANLPVLEQAARCADAVLVADSRVPELPDPAYRRIREIPAVTFPNLGEFDEFGTVRLFYRPPNRDA
jgi:predicted nicotinamide N-methyase